MKIIIKRYKEEVFELSEEQIETLMKEEKCNDADNVFYNFSDCEICEYFEENGKYIETIDEGYDVEEPFRWFHEVFKNYNYGGVE